jgi:Zn-dependent protease
MDANAVIDGLILYIGLVLLLTFHEFGHAWTALKCGDDTAKLQGRVSLNPLVHIDLIGTVIIPLVALYLSLAGSIAANFLIGWAKPVPVNPHNLRHGKLDDILVTLAGPGMNVLLAIVLIGLARVGLAIDVQSVIEICGTWAFVSLILCFFNLIPIPPLDGSQVVRVLSGMSYETFHRIAQYGFIVLILVLQIDKVRSLLSEVTLRSWLLIADLFGLKLAF